MDEPLHTLDISNLNSLNNECCHQALVALELGKVVYLSNYFFKLQVEEEKLLLSETILDGKRKNVSFDYPTQRIGGVQSCESNIVLNGLLKNFMQNYSLFAYKLVVDLFPQYEKALLWGRTSYRPAEIKGRTISKRKDDTRLHIDSFPATPVYGKRILRVFCNVNPYGEPRVWHVGEPFSKVISHFAPKLPTYSYSFAKLLFLLKVTKTLRSAYDHYQLNLHDTMKLDDHYQRYAPKQRIDFPAQSTWIVFTDQVSHAALSGQYLLEQTFYLPVPAMAMPETSPLKQWELQKKQTLLRAKI